MPPAEKYHINSLAYILHSGSTLSWVT